MPVDTVPLDEYKCRNWVKDYFFELKWYGVYDLVEFIVASHEWITHTRDKTRLDHETERDELIEAINAILEDELSGYRFISGVLTPISDKTEVEAVQEAESRSRAVGLAGSAEHIHTALELLGKKPKPDYRNAIKEAISAVESTVKQLSGVASSGLAPALEELSRKTELHGALKSAFNQLYGYTSDEDGIRHAILEEKQVGFDEAKYMIVACSAFVNFLISKAEATGLFATRAKM